jgi:beta-lactam-binding protein with PASTA domain
VVGQTEAQARATLAQAGFDVSVVYVTGTGNPGTVVAQSPTADTSLRLGSVVTISVLQAPSPTPTPSPPSPSPPGSGSPSASP